MRRNHVSDKSCRLGITLALVSRNNNKKFSYFSFIEFDTTRSEVRTSHSRFRCSTSTHHSPLLLAPQLPPQNSASLPQFRCRHLSDHHKLISNPFTMKKFLNLDAVFGSILLSNFVSAGVITMDKPDVATTSTADIEDRFVEHFKSEHILLLI